MITPMVLYNDLDLTNNDHVFCKHTLSLVLCSSNALISGVGNA